MYEYSRTEIPNKIGSVLPSAALFCRQSTQIGRDRPAIGDASRSIIVPVSVTRVVF